MKGYVQSLQLIRADGKTIALNSCATLAGAFAQLKGVKCANCEDRVLVKRKRARSSGIFLYVYDTSDSADDEI